MEPRKIGCGGVDWIHVVQNRMAHFKHGNEP